jgi:hypothetical protein
MGEVTTLVRDREDQLFATHPDLLALSSGHNSTVRAPVPAAKIVSAEVLGYHWLEADAIAPIREARLASKGIAKQIMESRMQQLREGDFDAVPNPVDPLTTAARANQAKAQYGEESEQYKRARYSLVVDCRRLFAEGMRKLTWEYFPEIEQEYDESTGGYQFMDRQLLDMVGDGITPVAEAEEGAYRITEYVEEATFMAVRKYGRAALNGIVERPDGVVEQSDFSKVHVITVSECADWAIAAHAKNPKALFGGYVPEIQKLMIRGVRYDPATGNRYQEQLGLSGVHITHDIINEALTLLLKKPRQQRSKKEVRDTQVINTGGQDVIAFAALLDELASRASGKRIFRGEVIPEDQLKDYATIKPEATRRQGALLEESERLADFLMTLEANGEDHWESQGLVEHYVNKTIFNKVKKDPSQARVVFNEETANTLQQAHRERARGNEMAARALELQAEQNAPPIVFCGAGSCGLVEVSKTSAKGAAIGETLNAKAGDVLVQATDVPCKNCGKTGDVYILYSLYDPKKVNKMCKGCGAKDVKKAATKKSDVALAA